MDEHSATAAIVDHHLKQRDAMQLLSEAQLRWQFVEQFSRAPDSSLTHGEMIDLIAHDRLRRALGR
jgi:hypothetical protein